MHCTRLAAGGLACCWRLLALCALCLLCAATPCAYAASSAWRPDAPLASHAMLYLDAPYSFKRTMFQQSAELGARSIRVDLALTAVFTADGSEDWRGVDEVMALARGYGLRPVGVLLATPWFIAACGAEPYSYACPPADLEAWKRMVSRIVAHTRGVIDTFEILNEPDGRWAFTGSAADYAKLLRAGHDATKAANPHAQVAIAGTMGLASRPWLAEVFAQAGPHPERLYDIVNVHIRASLQQLPGHCVPGGDSSWLIVRARSRCGSPSSATRPTLRTSTTTHTVVALRLRPLTCAARCPSSSLTAQRRCFSPCATTSAARSRPRA
jgi:hypothetical protein